ncbi:MAG: proline dehydrogenase [Gemmatimonadetes bacterium]|nr:MAG: proline dehydrogenase [Gemmatimonadota bacterium]
MGIARSTLLWCSRNRWIENQFRHRRFAKKAVSRFIPGEDVGSALGAARDLAKHHIATVVTQLGENVSSMAEAEQVTKHYLAVLDEARDLQPRPHISVKLTQLGLDIDRAATVSQLEQLVSHAATTNNVVWIDMEGSNYVDITLEIHNEVRSKHDNVGVCLQAYLHRTPKDLEDLLAMGSTIRLVKGAYQEPPSVAMASKRDVDAAFLDLAIKLGEHAARGAPVKPGIATHDTALLAQLEKHAVERGWGKDVYEIQMLYGIRRREHLRLAAAGVPMRVLISYGDAWFAWYVRRLAERPANVGFVLRSMLWR